jgi:hypothetical protein
MGVVKVVCFFQ